MAALAFFLRRLLGNWEFCHSGHLTDGAVYASKVVLARLVRGSQVGNQVVDLREQLAKKQEPAQTNLGTLAGLFGEKERGEIILSVQLMELPPGGQLSVTIRRAERRFFSRYLGACRRRPPRTRVDLKVSQDAPRPSPV